MYDESEKYVLVNPEKREEYDGDMYSVGLWQGSGYQLDMFAAYAEDESGALDEVVRYCAAHKEYRRLVIDDIERIDICRNVADTSTVVREFPSWAVEYATYGKDASGNLSAEEREMVDAFMEKNNLGTLTQIVEKTHNDFNPCPAFGLGSDTYTAFFRIRDIGECEEKLEERISETDCKLLDEGYFVTTDTDYCVRGENLKIEKIDDADLVRRIEERALKNEKGTGR